MMNHDCRMVEHLTGAPDSEALIGSLAELGVAPPPRPSDAAVTLQLDGMKLPSSLTALAAPLASAVARVEALTAAEVDEDAWTRDTLENFTLIAQKFVDASRTLQAPPALAPESRRCSAEVSLADVAAPEPAAPEAASPEPAAVDARAERISESEEAAAAHGGADEEGKSEEVAGEPPELQAESSASGYASSAGDCSEGSVAAGSATGSVSVNLAGVNGADEGNSVADEEVSSPSREPGVTFSIAHGAEDAGDAGEDVVEVTAAQPTADVHGAVGTGSDEGEASTARGGEGDEVSDPAGTVVSLGSAGEAHAEDSVESEGAVHSPAVAVDSVDAGEAVVATVDGVGGDDCMEDGGDVVAAASLVHSADHSEAIDVEVSERADAAVFEGEEVKGTVAVKLVLDLMLHRDCGKGGVFSGTESITDIPEAVHEQPSGELGDQDASQEAGEHRTSADEQDVVSDKAEEESRTASAMEPGIGEEEETEHPAIIDGMESGTDGGQLQDVTDVQDDAEETGQMVADTSEMHEDVLEHETKPEVLEDEDAEPLDMPQLDMPEVLEEPMQEEVLDEAEVTNSAEACCEPEVSPVDLAEGDDVHGANAQTALVPCRESMTQLLLVRAEDAIDSGIVEGLHEEDMPGKSDVPDTKEQVQPALAAGSDVDPPAGMAEYGAVMQTQASGSGRSTRESDVAEAMVDEVLEETLASMLSADAQQFPQ